MMPAPLRVLVTGASGFVGQHVVAALLQRGHQVRAVGRKVASARQQPWFEQVQWQSADLHDPSLDIAALTDGVDAMVHLAWPGLPNYQARYHFEQTLFADYRFIQSVVGAGVSQVLVAGTCFEYGLLEGPLSEQAPTQPNTAYGLAKTTLLSFLQQLQREQPFTLQWARLFYLHGSGQNPNSLLASLDRAIDTGAEHFNMSGGEQLRDYLPIERAACLLGALLERRDFTGVVNCCSGQPLSVRNLVEQRLRERDATLRLNLGHYPYSPHEPMAFWGNNLRLRHLLGADYVA